MIKSSYNDRLRENGANIPDETATSPPPGTDPVNLELRMTDKVSKNEMVVIAGFEPASFGVLCDRRSS